MPRIVKSGGMPLIAALVLLFGWSGTAKAQTVVYPRDGHIEYIKFVRDGIEIKLTSLGLQAGLDRGRADQMALNVRWWHSRTFNISSAINYRRLGWQIQAHCQGYRAGYLMTFNPRPHIADAGRRLMRQSNPINVVWGDIIP